MFVLLNGSFGIGKTTVAGLLERELPNAVIYDPERVGYVLRRLPAWALGLREQPADYQDLPQWRSLIARGARGKQRGRNIVVVPMAFTNRSYFEDFACALARRAEVQRLCLVAPLAVVRSRLAKRAESEGRDVGDFELRRSEECVTAHREAAFGRPIDATRSPQEIVAEIRSSLGH